MLLLNFFVLVTVTVVGVDALKPQHIYPLNALHKRSPNSRRCRPRPAAPQAAAPPGASYTTTTTPPAPATTPSNNGFIPNNIKAGIAGGDAYPFLQDHIGWWYDWYGPTLLAFVPRDLPVGQVRKPIQAWRPYCGPHAVGWRHR